MEVKELSNFIDRTLNKWKYSIGNKFSQIERVFSQMLKVSEETGELSEQVLWKFGWQRLDKMDKINDEKLSGEIADVILSTMRLARMLDIDIEKALVNKMEILKERFNKL